MQRAREVGELASRQHGLVTAEQLAALGMTKSAVTYQVGKGGMRRLPGGVLALPGTADTWEQRICWASLAAGPVGGASHRSAARLWQMRSFDTEIEVSIRYPRKLSLPGAIVHRSVDLLPTDLTWVEGIATTTVERTIVDLGLVFPEAEVMRILRHAIATNLVSRRDVVRIRKRVGKSGRDGAGVSDRCLEQLPDEAEDTESGIEVLFLEICERFDLPRPSVQVPVIAGGKRYRLDFAYVPERIFVEIDGVPTHSEPHQIAADGFRQNNLVLAGWQPLRLMYHHMKTDPGRCADMIAEILAL